MATEAQHLLLLLSWMSPAFPVGSFAYSHGLEQAIASGTVKTPAELEEWVGELLLHGSAWNDAILFSRCWQDDRDELNGLALALAGSSERWLETVQLGRNFAVAAAAWMAAESAGGDVAYPVAAGAACRAMGVDQHQALLAFLQGFAAAQVSVAVRLVPLGQTQGLLVLRNLGAVIESVAGRAIHATLDDLGNACLLADIAAMKHETLEPRIFRS